MSDQAQGLRVLANQLRGESTDCVAQPRGADPLSSNASPAAPVRTRVDEDAEPLLTSFAVADVRLHPTASREPQRARTRIVAITSGKGGVGKSNFAANLSVTLGRRGQRVVLIDADVGLANAHILLGTTPPFGIDQVMRGAKKLPAVLAPAAENVRLIAGGSSMIDIAALTNSARDAFLVGLRELESACDLIVIDTGAGVANNVLAFLCAVNEILVVTTPEATAIANAYATIKVVSQENPGARIMLVVNMVHSSGEGAAVAERLTATTRQFLDLEVEYLGCIPIDPAVPRAVRLRTPFVSTAPGCAAAGGINQIICKLGYGLAGDVASAGVDGFVSRLQRFLGVRGRR